MPDDIATVEALVNPDGTFAENYLDTMIEGQDGQQVNLFPDEVRQDKTIQNITNLPAAYDMLRRAEKMVGKNKVGIPASDAPDEEWDAVMKALGMPDAAEGYGLTAEVAFADVPEDKRDPEMLEWFGTTAHKHRLLPQQVLGFLADWNEFALGRDKKLQDDFNEDIETGMRELKERLGAQYSREMEHAEKLISAACNALARYGYKEPAQHDMEQRLCNDIRKDPRIGAVVMAMASLIAPDTLEGLPGGKEYGMTPAEAQQQIDAVMADKDHPYHKGDAKAVERVSRLYEIASGVQAPR